MEIFNLIFHNRELIKLVYALLVAFICLVIVLKTDKLFRLSLHQGIRYFRNAFFFYALAFLSRYFLRFLTCNDNIVNGVFEFFLIMAGFFLLYSLLSKRFESHRTEGYFSSLLNPYVFIFYLMTFLIVILDLLWSTFYFMFLSQIIIFAIATLISFYNHKNNGVKVPFLRFYFIAMSFAFIAWVLNLLAAVSFAWNPFILLVIYVLNVGVFLLFLYGVLRFTKKIN